MTQLHVHADFNSEVDLKMGQGGSRQGKLRLGNVGRGGSVKNISIGNSSESFRNWQDANLITFSSRKRMMLFAKRTFNSISFVSFKRTKYII
jgi:hypothetical protein